MPVCARTNKMRAPLLWRSIRTPHYIEAEVSARFLYLEHVFFLSLSLPFEHSSDLCYASDRSALAADDSICNLQFLVSLNESYICCVVAGGSARAHKHSRSRKSIHKHKYLSARIKKIIQRVTEVAAIAAAFACTTTMFCARVAYHQSVCRQRRGRRRRRAAQRVGERFGQSMGK